MHLPLLHELLEGDPLACVDIGASGGIPAEWQAFGPLLCVDTLDPDGDSLPGEVRTESRTMTRSFPVALGGRTEKRKFYVLNRPTGSSFYPPNVELLEELNVESYFGVDKVIDVETYAFSEFLREFDRPRPNLIKLDTQGSELEILSSLDDEDWQDVLLVVSEVEFEELYEGQPLFHDVDSFMREKGFRLFDLRTARSYLAGNNQTNYYLKEHYNLAVGSPEYSAKLYAGDALYVRDWKRHEMRANNRWPKLILSFLLYSYYDYPLRFCELAGEQGVLTPAQQECLTREIVATAPKPHLHQRSDRLGQAARRVLRACGYRGSFQAYWMRRQHPNQ